MTCAGPERRFHHESGIQANSFFSNVPGILLPGETYGSSEVFRVLLSGNAPVEDYGGTVTLRGRTDIFASGELATAPFTVLSPAVGILASDASASEAGADSGVFTITRSGSTAIDLPVFFTVSGSAINGVSYVPITPSAVIPAGSDPATVTITPIPNNIGEGDRTVILSLGTSSTYNLGSPLSDNVTIHDKAADAWRFEKFGANANDPAAADNGDWEGDGLRNLLEFALSLDPKISDRAGLPSASIVEDFLTISYVPNASATDVNYVVESSTNLVDWSSADVEVVNVPDPVPAGRQTFRYKIPLTLSESAFLRLRVERTDL